jgi:hypothetical protein
MDFVENVVAPILCTVAATSMIILIIFFNL